MSLSAKCRVVVRSAVPSRRIRPSSAIRSSIGNRRRRSWPSTASSSPASAFDRKPTLPRLMPRIGTSTSATARTARRNVPSPPRTTSASVVGSSRTSAVEVARLGLPLVDAADLAPAGGPGAELDGRLDRRVVGEADARRRSSGRSTSAIRSPISAQPGPGARWTRNSRLPSGPVIGEAMTARVPSPRSRRRGDDPLEDLAMDRRVADDAVVGPALAGLELRLDEGDDVPRGAAERRRDGPRTIAERDERDVDRRRGRSARAGSWRSASRALVRSIETTRGSRRSESASWPRPTSRA